MRPRVKPLLSQVSFPTNAARSWHYSKCSASQQTQECCTDHARTAEGAQATSATAQDLKNYAMPPAKSQQIFKDGNRGRQPPFVPTARRSMQNVIFANEFTAPRHRPGGQNSTQCKHVSTKDAGTQWSREDNWGSQPRLHASSNPATTRPASGRRSYQTNHSKEEIRTQWYERRYTVSKRK